jgi:predicted ATPase
MLKPISLLIFTAAILLSFITPAQAKEEDEFLAKNFLNLGVKAYESEKIGPAIYYFRQALSLHPKLSEAHGKLGQPIIVMG